MMQKFYLLTLMMAMLTGITQAKAELSLSGGGGGGGGGSGKGPSVAISVGGGYSGVELTQLSGTAEKFSGFPLKVKLSAYMSPRSPVQVLFFAYGEKSSLKSSLGTELSALMYSIGAGVKIHRFSIFMGGYLGNLDFKDTSGSYKYTSKGFNGGLSYSLPFSKHVGIGAEYEHLFWNVSGTGSTNYSSKMDGSVERGFLGLEFYF